MPLILLLLACSRDKETGFSDTAPTPDSPWRNSAPCDFETPAGPPTWEGTGRLDMTDYPPEEGAVCPGAVVTLYDVDGTLVGGHEAECTAIQEPFTEFYHCGVIDLPPGKGTRAGTWEMEACGTAVVGEASVVEDLSDGLFLLYLGDDCLVGVVARSGE